MQLSDFTAGMRIETDPASDRWMSGDRFGTVQPVKGRKYVTVKMDRSGKVVKLLPDHLTIIGDEPITFALREPGDRVPVTQVPTPAQAFFRIKPHSTRYSAPRTPQTPEQDNARTRRQVQRSRGVQDISRMMLRGT